MTQRNVEWLLGRLLTDEDLRTAFVRDPATTLGELQGQGWELTPTEVEALVSADMAVWRDLARTHPGTPEALQPAHEVDGVRDSGFGIREPGTGHGNRAPGTGQRRASRRGHVVVVDM